MIEFKDFDESKLYEYSSDNLRMFVNEIEMKLSVLREQCATEMSKYLKDERFDLYSISGKRKIKKIAKRFSDMLEGASEYLRIIRVELAKREKLEDDMKYSGKGYKIDRISQEEFLQKEQDKTMAFKIKNGIEIIDEEK